jgi:DNA-binding NtrC family response regulator
VKTLAQVKHDYIIKVLDAKNGNRRHAAKELGMGIRTLQRHLKINGLTGYKNSQYSPFVFVPEEELPRFRGEV